MAGKSPVSLVIWMGHPRGKYTKNTGILARKSRLMSRKIRMTHHDPPMWHSQSSELENPPDPSGEIKRFSAFMSLWITRLECLRNSRSEKKPSLTSKSGKKNTGTEGWISFSMCSTLKIGAFHPMEGHLALFRVEKMWGGPSSELVWN